MRRLVPSILLSTSLLASALLGASDASAEPTPGSAEMREAETRFQEGLALYSQGNINDARVKLVQAYAVLGRTNILWNLAVAEFYSSRFLESVRHMRAFIRAADAEPADVAIAKEKFLPELEKHTGRIEVKAPRASAIAVDGDELGSAPLAEPVDVLPGNHLVLARTAKGNATSQVTASAGQVVSITLGDVNEANALPTEGGGGAAGTADRGPEKSSTSKTVTVAALGGGALVAAGLGVVFLLSSSSSDDDATALRAKLGGDRSACFTGGNSDCTALSDANDSRDGAQGAATGFFIGAGVLAIGAGLAYFLWPSGGSSKSSAGVRFTPSSKLTFHF